VVWFNGVFVVFEGIARLCCDARRNVRSQALTYIHKALLMHDLQTLTAIEWENCFNKVIVIVFH
jgi:golgi-specific brefeldin A-resistance guanine nucleotide exchange factor 1